METAIVAALAEQGIEARGRDCDGPQYTGVWVGERKIASIGIHVSRGVSIHGFALNVDNDLQPFEWAVACGLPDVQMTSVCRETGRTGTMPALARAIAAALVPSVV
jgi:lipoyl(octanoyl) transferase